MTEGLQRLRKWRAGVNKLHALLRIIQEHVTNSEVLATSMYCRKGLSR
jgi:hypothetical protein